MSYKKNAASNRDSLFGPSPGGGGGGGASKPPGGSRSGTTGRSAATSSAGGASLPPPTVTNKNAGGYAYTTTTASSSSASSSRSRAAAQKRSLLSPEARAAKLQEADEHKAKAKAAMGTGLLKRPDPLVASTYYKRAADCYRAAGEVDLERYFRVSSAQCNAQVGAWATAAAEYTAAADLAMAASADGDSSDDLGGGGGDRPPEQNCIDASSYHQLAAEAWRNQGDPAKAAQSQVHAALCLNASSRGSLLSRSSLALMEEAVEAHVPDVLNPFARYRQTGHSSFVDPTSGDETVENPSPETLAMAREHLVSRSYAHEPLQKLAGLLAGYGEYASALYASGAVSTLLGADGISTLSLSRAYVVETILQLAMGDPVAAEQTFLSRHCNSRPYLSSREAQLAEELTQAIKRRDLDALDEARSPSGRNRSALANLDESLRALVGQLRISGVARKAVGDTAAAASAGSSDRSAAGPSAAAAEAGGSLQEILAKKTGYEEEAEQGAHLDGDELAAELDGLDFGGGSEDGSLEDDDDGFDLR